MSDRSIVEMLRAIKAREWVSEDDVAYLGTLVRWVTATSDGPCVGGKGLVLNESGKEVLALADECERWRLRSVWKEIESNRQHVQMIIERLKYAGANASERQAVADRLAVMEEAARDAYIASGGVE